MTPLLAHAHGIDPFDLKAALLARHAQHPALVHFPIALFMTSVLFEALSVWRKNPTFASVAYYNLVGAALTVPIALISGLAAWQLQFEGAKLKGNLQLHLICAVTTALLIFTLCWMRTRLFARSVQPGSTYAALALVALLAVSLTGHVGGIVSGVEIP